MRILIFTLVLLNSLACAHADDAVQAQAFLQKIQLASKKVSYAGTFVFQHENQLIASRIIHSYEAGDELEKIETLDGLRREYIRHNEDIISYQPDSKTLRIEKRQSQDMFPAVLAFGAPDLNEHYQFKLAETARVAGVDCRMISIEPKDMFRYGYRLCAAIPNNLMLQAQTTDADNQVLEQIAFTSLSFGHVAASSLKTDFPDTGTWKTVRDAVAESTESGWMVTRLPAGFKKMREVRCLLNANLDGSPGKRSAELHEVLQMVFSDGLATVSVFIEPSNPAHHAGIIQKGATTVSEFQLQNFWVTLVGEVPAAALKILADSIEYKPK